MLAMHFLPNIDLHIEFDGDMHLEDYVRYQKACDEIAKDMEQAMIQRIADLNSDVVVRAACGNCT